jgi:hypothetical protein
MLTGLIVTDHHLPPIRTLYPARRQTPVSHIHAGRYDTFIWPRDSRKKLQPAMKVVVRRVAQSV